MDGNGHRWANSEGTTALEDEREIPLAALQQTRRLAPELEQTIMHHNVLRQPKALNLLHHDLLLDIFATGLHLSTSERCLWPSHFWVTAQWRSRSCRGQPCTCLPPWNPKPLLAMLFLQRTRSYTNPNNETIEETGIVDRVQGGVHANLLGRCSGCPTSRNILLPHTSLKHQKILFRASLLVASFKLLSQTCQKQRW